MDFRFHTGRLEVFTRKDEATGEDIRFLRGVASDDKIDRHGERFSKNALARFASYSWIVSFPHPSYKIFACARRRFDFPNFW